jgi:hypothetical protein
VVGVFKETGSGVKVDRAKRRKVMALAQARRVDAVLVTELSRWGRSTTDLLATLKELEARRVSVVALIGMTFDLATPHGRMSGTGQVKRPRLGRGGYARDSLILRTADTLCHPDGRTMVVNTPEHRARLMQEGWSTILLAPHLKRPVSHHGVLGANNHRRSDRWRGTGASP